RLASKYFPKYNQVKDWLNKAGFIIEQEYGDYNKNPISETTSRAIVYARK
ncbi:MAG: Methyltransferase type 12, partial [Clostridia bacterium]|nr:Methyltransferase type 12 [Clostridia bacterium]